MRRLALFAALSVAAPAARAQTQQGPLPPSPTDYVYARSLALSAYRGLAGDNDAIFYNPGALAARKRFSTELQGLMFRDGSETTGSVLSGSVVDSTSSSVTGGFAYSYAKSLGYQPSGFFGGGTDVAVAFPVGRTLFVGATGTYLDLTGTYNRVNAINVTLGLLWQVAKMVSLGASGYNLINTCHPDLTPRALGAGVAIGPDDVFHITGDFYREWGLAGPRNVWAAGGELFLFDVVAVRGGWLFDPGRHSQWWSGGLGFMTSGFGMDVTYRQAFGGANWRVLAAGIKVLLPSM